MALDDSLNGRQPDSRAGKFFRRMHALERSKQIFGVGLVKSRSVVAHDKHLLVVLTL
jgi:hypothetical protein